jgi:hypothetical protein
MKNSRAYQVLVQADTPGRRGAAMALGLATQAVLGAERASAHQVMGLTGFPSLVVHPLAEIELLLGLLALSLLSFRLDRASLLVGWAVASGGAVAGMLLQTAALTMPGLWRLPLLTALAVAVPAACGSRGRLAAWAGAAAIGLALGLGLPRERPGLLGALETPAAAAISVGCVLAMAGLLSRVGAGETVRLAARIAASWIAAIALLGLWQR